MPWPCPPKSCWLPPSNLLAYCREQDIDEVVVGMDDRRTSFPVGDLLDCRLAGVGVIELIDFLERETGRVRLDVVNPSWMIFSGGFAHHPVQLAVKRALDIGASLVLLAFAWPILLLAMLAIKLEDGLRAPVFYRQTRVGLNGQLFDVLKLRSMRTDAEKAGAQWAVKGDPRVTRVGHFCRITRIDELPQIINVLRGDMAFVGPRPERPAFVDRLSEMIPYYRERHCMKARHYRLGTALLPLRRLGPRLRAEAGVRPLLREEPQPPVRRDDSDPDGRGGAVGQGR